jgi:hypothetical protein
MGFQRRAWIVERAGWLALTAVALLALSGLFGVGALSTASIANGSLTVDYERFQRVTRLAKFTIRFAPAPDKARRLRLSRTFQENYEISSTQPPPANSHATPDGLELVFSAAEAGAGEAVIWAQPRSYGRMWIDAAAGDGAPARFWIFVYP